jgi:hypothetical protein
MAWGRRLCFCLWATCLFLGGNETGRAADWILTPSIETRAEYLNNIFYSPYFKKSDYILSAVPKLEYTYNTERTQIGASLRLNGLHYIQNPNLDTINQSYNINANTLATSRLKLNLIASYLSTTNSTEAVNVTNVFTIRQRIKYISVSPGLSYSLTERLSTDLSYIFNNVDYQYNPFQNYLTHTINSRLNYLYDEKTTFIASITAAYSQYQKTDNNILSLGPQIGFNRKFTENWDMTFLGGANFSQVESTVAVNNANNYYEFIQIPQVQKEKTFSVNPFINISTNLNWQKGGIILSYVRSQSPNYYTNQSQYNNFNLVFRQEVTEKINLNINPYFNIATFQGNRTNYDQYYLGIIPKITYKLTEKISIGANYNLGYRKNTGSINYAFPINDVYVFLNYSYPIHFQR